MVVLPTLTTSLRLANMVRAQPKRCASPWQMRGLSADDIHYINAHGTSTQLNDTSETNALKMALGEVAYQIPISSTKSMTGHMLGAAGSAEAIFSILAMRDNFAPPTINYETPDSSCDLDYTVNEGVHHEICQVMTNSFGFGGHNAVLILGQHGN